MELTPRGPAPSGATASAAPLPAHEPTWSRRLREHPHLLAEMARAARGPFHVLHPPTFADNVRSFQNALLTAGVDGQVHFGKKANKSGCWLRVCAATGAGVDVASGPELANTLAGGVPGEDIVVTGPAKSTALLSESVAHGALIAIDALDELRRLIALARGGAPARILLRVLPTADPTSRFGFDTGTLDTALQMCVEARHVLDMEGFSFHLGGYEPGPRAAQADELLARCLDARAHGLRASAISIGGGFAVSYVDAASWRRFVDGHDDSWFHAAHRPPRFYPYHQEPTGADMLGAVLASPATINGTTAGGTLAEAFARGGVRVLVEPGRALLDGSGFSVFGVQGYKTRRDAHGEYGIVTVDGLSMSISEQWKGSEFLPDPVLWPEAPILEPVEAAVGGASCLEYDMLTWRKVPFPRSPQFGDLLVYPNTAGYQMDKNESEFHQLPLPARFVLDDSVPDRPAWHPLGDDSDGETAS